MTMKVTHHYDGDDDIMQDFVEKLNRETLKIDTTDMEDIFDTAIAEGTSDMHDDVKLLQRDNAIFHDNINKNLVRLNLQLSDILVRLSIIEEKLYNH